MNEQNSELAIKLEKLLAAVNPSGDEWIAPIRTPQSASDFFEPYAVWTNRGPSYVSHNRSIFLAANDAMLICELVNNAPKFIEMLKNQQESKA